LFVHGCFWHQHPDPDCRLRKPAGGDNQGYWGLKLERNIARDARRRTELEALGWRVLVVWECEVLNPKMLYAVIEEIASMPRRYPKNAHLAPERS
jgi:DNA mismatch endonuclease (patch repair protein)